MSNGNQHGDSGGSGSTDVRDQADLALRARYSAKRIAQILQQAEEVLRHKATHEGERAQDLIFAARLETVRILQLFPEAGTAGEGERGSQGVHGEDPEETPVARLNELFARARADRLAYFDDHPAANDAVLDDSRR